MGLGRGLATRERGAAQAGAGIIGAADGDQRAGEGELVTGGGALCEAEAAQALVVIGRSGVIATPGGRSGEAGERIRLQWIEHERARPGDLGLFGAALAEEIADGGPRARAGAVIAARLREPRHLAPCIDRGCGIDRRQDRRGHLVDRGIIGGEVRGDRELLLRALRIVELVDEHVGEAKSQLHGTPGLRRDHGSCAHEAHELGPAVLVGVAICERVGRFARARVVLERQLVERRGRARLEHAQQPRTGERGERGLIVIAIAARELRELREVTGGLARIALRERDRGERRVRGREVRPPPECLARELESVEEPRGPCAREREDPLEQQRLLRSAGGEQRAIAAHRFLGVTLAQ